MSMKKFERLQRFLSARGPCGQEDEVRELCLNELRPFCQNVDVDLAGNVIGTIKGVDHSRSVNLYAHMDEISMIVKRIEKDGKIRVRALGGLYPFNLGQGPVEILASSGILPGILSVGAMHVSAESKVIWQLKGKEKSEGRSLTWEHVHIFTGKDPKTLEGLGVYPGTRVVVAQERRKLFVVDKYLGAHFFDNRAGLEILMQVAERLKKEKVKPRYDLRIVCSASEEIQGIGALFDQNNRRNDINIAVDVGPVAAEYQSHLESSPSVVYRDSRTIYDKRLTDEIASYERHLSVKVRRAVWEGYGSDTSIAKLYGHTTLNALITFPTENTHGYEIIDPTSLTYCAELLFYYLKGE